MLPSCLYHVLHHPFPYGSWMMLPCQCPTLYLGPNAQVTTAFLLRSPLLPQSHHSPFQHRNLLCMSLLPGYLYWDLAAPPQSSLPAPQGSKGPSPKPPHPGAGRQCRARASLEPLGCLLRLPTASVPGEVSKASDPRTGMRKASSKQSQLPAPARGGEGRAAGPAPRHCMAQQSAAPHPCTAPRASQSGQAPG